MCTQLKCLTSPVSVFSDIFQPYTHYTLVFFSASLVSHVQNRSLHHCRSSLSVTAWFWFYVFRHFSVVGGAELKTRKIRTQTEQFPNFRHFHWNTNCTHIRDEQKNFELKFQNSVCSVSAKKKFESEFVFVWFEREGKMNETNRECSVSFWIPRFILVCPVYRNHMIQFTCSCVQLLPSILLHIRFIREKYSSEETL